MKRAKVAHLKAHLSQYLTEVRAGASVIVCDRNTPIARLVPFEEHADGFVVHEAQHPLQALRKVRGVRPRHAVDVIKLLRASRDQR